MGQMNRSLNLPQVCEDCLAWLTIYLQIQKIMNDFERESSTMDMKEEMMSDAVDDAMEGEDEGEGEEVESDKILKEVLDEIGMNMNEAVSSPALNHIRVANDLASDADNVACLGAHGKPSGQRTGRQHSGSRPGGPRQLSGSCSFSRDE
jgi:charged multivesicular body protein 2A